MDEAGLDVVEAGDIVVVTASSKKGRPAAAASAIFDTLVLGLFHQAMIMMIKPLLYTSLHSGISTKN